VWSTDIVQPLGATHNKSFGSYLPKPTSKRFLPANSTESKAAIENIMNEVRSMSEAFVLPSHLDFLEGPAGGMAQLASTQHNAPYIEQRDTLMDLVGELEGIPKYGFEDVRVARVEAIDLVINELLKMSALKAKLWKEVSIRSTMSEAHNTYLSSRM
jgi:hypothetical protein